MGDFQEGLWCRNLAMAHSSNQTQVVQLIKNKSYGDFECTSQYRFLLASGSMSESSLVSVAGLCS